MRRAFAAAYTLPKRGKESCHRAVLLPSKLKVNSASGMAWQPCAAAHATQTSLSRHKQPLKRTLLSGVVVVCRAEDVSGSVLGTSYVLALLLPDKRQGPGQRQLG